jgi:RNA polymerase sigma factor (sigma-70 family)
MGISMEEIQEDRLKTVWGAAISFKENKKTKFSSWLANHIRYQCLKKITKKSREPHCVEIDKIQVSDKIIAFKENLNYVFNLLDKMADKRIKQIFEMKYSEKELNFSQIATVLDLSPFRVSQLHKIGLEKLRRKIKKDVDFQKKEE